MAALAEKYRETPIDILLSNAGVSGGTPQQQTFGSIDYAEFDRAITVNTYGPLKLAEVFLPQVLASKEKKIIADTLKHT
jgi:short-subunit dehydrogenase